MLLRLTVQTMVQTLGLSAQMLVLMQLLTVQKMVQMPLPAQRPVQTLLGLSAQMLVLMQLLTAQKTVPLLQLTAQKRVQMPTGQRLV